MNMGRDTNTGSRIGAIAPIASAVRSRQISAVEVLDDALRRIDALDGELHAFCTLDATGARAQAIEVDQRIARGQTVGPLAGVPVGVKDLIATRGLLTTYGSRLYSAHVPTEDDVVVERLRAAGAVIIGKTNTSEFGYGAFGHNTLFATTRNPWDTRLTPGGSSAGSGAAVAANMVPLALGSDGGGSVRLPAALCGVYGIKPSWGRVPVYPGCRDERLPGISSWESLEHIGPITRTVADAALALSAMTGPTPRDRGSIPREFTDWSIASPETLRGKRIAFSADLGWAVVDSEVRIACEAAARRIEQAYGCIVEFAQPDIDDYGAAFETLVGMETDRVGLRRMAAEQRVELKDWLARLLAREWTADEFTAAQFARKRVVNATWRFMERYDFFLTPTTACVAFGLDLEGPETIADRSVASNAWVAFSALGNFTGLPAASVPIGLSSANSLPVGLQIMGRHLDDLGVLALSAAVETLYPPILPPVAWQLGWAE
jgi:aspartyl-tRNA(Asn)/glutamyl-tRNA(Gln) amidotransferase subunit A